MSIGEAGQFQYEATVPERHGDMPWLVRSTDTEERRSRGSEEISLLGSSPRLEITDAGLTPNPGFTGGVWRPEVLRSRIALTAVARRGAHAARASFHVDKGLTSRLRPGDVVNITRTGCAGMGLSVVRDDELVVAIGAVTKVSLGRNAKARVARDLAAEAEAVFKRRYPEFELRELPIQLTIDGQDCLVPGGPSTGSELPERYACSGLHGFIPGVPGTDECLFISLIGSCPDTAARPSATLLLADGIDIVAW